MIRPTPTPSFSATELLRKVENSPEALVEVSGVLTHLSCTQPAQAVELAEGIYAITTATPGHDPAAGAWILGEALLHVGQYGRANHYLALAYQGYTAAGETLPAARVGVSYVGSLAYLGQLEEALALAAQAEPILTQSAKRHKRDLHYLAQLPMYVGLAYELMGDCERALAVYDQQMAQTIGLGDPGLLARLNLCRARTLTQLSALGEALTAFAQAEFLLHSLDASPDLIRLQLDRNSLLIALGRYTEAAAAQTLIEQMLPMMDDIAQASQRLTLLRVQLALATAAAVPPALFRALQAAQATFAQAGSLADESLAWLLLGRCALRALELTAAQDSFTMVLDRARKSGESTGELRALHGLARVAQQQGRGEEAIALLELAIDKLESIRQRLQIDAFRVGFLSDHLALYHDLIALYLGQGQWEQTFQAVERAKSRLVSEKLALRRQTAVADALASPDAQVRQLAQQLQAVLGQLDQVYRQARVQQLRSLSAAAPAEAEATVATLEQMAHILTLQLQHHQPFYTALSNNQTVPLQQLQEILSKQIFIQYYTVHDRYYALVIAEHSILAHYDLTTTHTVAGLRKALAAALERMLSLSRQLAPQRLLQRLPALCKEINQHLSRLYQQLFRPLEGVLPSDAQIILSPDHELHLLPFHAFYDGDRYLVERYTFSYVPSASVLDHCTQQPRYGEGVFLCGYDDSSLPAVNAELRNLAQLFPQAVVTVGEAATTAAFQRYAPQRRIVHLSAHAAFHAERPLLSSIRLADRRLTLAEIVRLQLQATLVVLSGCETGYGQNHGADLVSLASGFLGAGAQALLVSLWSVEDQATARLMEDFYRRAQGGLALSSALCAAQRTLLAKGRTSGQADALYQHPAFWSPFVLVGNGMASLEDGRHCL